MRAQQAALVVLAEAGSAEADSAAEVLEMASEGVIEVY